MRSSHLFLPLLIGLSACHPATVDKGPGVPSSKQTVTLSGTALYRERIALPADAQLVVTISDVSLMDAPSVTIAQVTIPTKGRQVPLAFSLDYDPARIIARNRYSVSARILGGDGKLLWITDTHMDLPPAGQTIELQLVRVQQSPSQ
ncbi:MAG: YbaY family lipoprotein [Pseudomonadota bacterium]|jgi:putative lipoprotein|uniref:Lipoprotein-related protein n=1 Tax=hydrothermal vent metagenome TaxID=652676 RepID=A0A160TP74_9ZZZZ